MLSKDDLAYSIVEDYLSSGPEFIDIAEAAGDNGYDSDEDFEEIDNRVQSYLQEIRDSF